jgi:alpha,alpha-trehalase
VIFDLDGVITDTARIHAAAWKDMFDAFLKARADVEGKSFAPFDSDQDYLEYVDGKPRYEGARDFLLSRGIDLPFGTPDDPPDRETICGLGNRKNQLFHEYLKKMKIDVYSSSVDLIKELRASGFHTAIVSSSKNCKGILESAGISDLFDVRVDGVYSEENDLKGKPAPDIFLEAAQSVETEPGRSVVVEDAISGVQAGRAGEFGLVVGVDRVGQAEALRKGGADVVVKDLSELRVLTDTDDKSTADLPSALDGFDQILATLGGKQPSFFLDYDGTLTPIVKRPEDARISSAMRKTVRRLAGLCPVTIVSGRDLGDVRNLVGLTEVAYAGSHGFDIAGFDGAGEKEQIGEEYLPILDSVETELNEELSGIKGSLVERKKFSVAVHYRNVESGKIGEVKKAVDEISERHPELRTSSGKRVYELQPNLDWDKGKAVFRLFEIRRLDERKDLPLYIGDDTTDEDAFKALRGTGISIVVEEDSKRTAADYVLRSVEDVQEFLGRMIDVLKGRDL